jgi:hypothetical protein
VRRKPLILLSLLLVMAALVLLGLIAKRDLSPPNGPPGPTGTLTGTLQAVGPSGDGPRALSGQITVRQSNGQMSGITVSASGRFSVPVPVGNFTVTARSPQYKSGTAECHASGTVTVTKGVTTKVQVDCGGVVVRVEGLVQTSNRDVPLGSYGKDGSQA